MVFSFGTSGDRSAHEKSAVQKCVFQFDIYSKSCSNSTCGAAFGKNTEHNKVVQEHL